MAAPDPTRVRGSSSPGSPGISGAIKDAVGAIATAVGPKAITQRGARLQQAEDDATGRMRAAQSSDADNSYGS